MAGYALRGLQKRYGERLVLDIPRMEVRRGDLLAVVGPSGAGKSTLLRLLHFLEPATAGEVAYSHNDGARVHGGWPAPLAVRRQIAMVFQRPEMVDGSVWENVALGLRFRGAVEPSRVELAIEQVDIAHLSHAHVQSLSGGELQRVALARLLAIRPRVALFDEPTANLDPANVLLVEGILKNLHAAGTTTVLVTHNVFQARRLASRVAFLLGGKLIEASDAEEFFNQPADERSLAFVRGEMVY